MWHDVRRGGPIFLLPALLCAGCGGAPEARPRTGDQGGLTVGGRQATLRTNGGQRQVVFDVAAGSLFVYGLGIGEEELLRVAGSLQPIDVRELRQRVAAR